MSCSLRCTASIGENFVRALQRNAMKMIMAATFDLDSLESQSHCSDCGREPLSERWRKDVVDHLQKRRLPFSAIEVVLKRGKEIGEFKSHMVSIGSISP